MSDPATNARMQIGSRRSASRTFQHSTAIGIRIPVSDLTSLAGNSKSTRAVEEFHSDICPRFVSGWVENYRNGTAIVHYYPLNNNEAKMPMLKNFSLKYLNRSNSAVTCSILLKCGTEFDD